MAGLCFTWLSAGISARELGFDPGPICKRFLVSGVAVGQVFLRVLQFDPLSFSLQNAAFHLLRANIAIRVSGETLGTEKDTLLITGEHRNN